MFREQSLCKLLAKTNDRFLCLALQLAICPTASCPRGDVPENVSARAGAYGETELHNRVARTQHTF
jgi:hypothetical protein